MFAVLALAWSAAHPVAERVIPTSAFHAVRLEAVATVHVSIANENKVILKGDPRTIGCIAAEANGGTLLIERRKRPPREHAAAGDAEVVVLGQKGCRRASAPEEVQIIVQTPSLDRVVLAGSNGNMVLDPISGPGLDVEIPGKGAIAVEGLRVRTTRLTVAGHGRIAVTGQPGHVSVAIAGSGTIDTGHAVASALDVSVAGHGHVMANVDGPVSGTIAGTATVTVHGHPTCRIHKAGKGKILCPA
jgi:hypothetical protein